ncbi:MAG: Hsp20/alpha crystallin family protein [Minisyncoccia bacterium]
MAIIPWKPFNDLDLERFFDDEFLSTLSPFRNEPAIDLYETDKDVVAEVNVPGIDPEKINVSVEDQVLRISGHIEDKKEEKEKGYWRKEIKRGMFERAIRLPVPIKEDAIDATYDNGILKIVMPKLSAKTKNIQIKVKK